MGFQSPKAPEFKRRSNPLELLMARDFLNKEEEGRKSSLAAQTTEETQRAKRTFDVENAYNALKGDFVQMRDLTLQIQNSMPGIINRTTGGAKNYLSLLKQDPTGVMLQRHQRIVDSSLRNIGILRANETESRFSNTDAERMSKLFGNPIWDTELQEDLDFAENARALDSRASSAGIQTDTSLFEEMFPETIPGMAGRKGASRILLGELIRDPSGLSNEELAEGASRLNNFQSLESLDPVLKQLLLQELEKRGVDI